MRTDAKFTEAERLLMDAGYTEAEIYAGMKIAEMLPGIVEVLRELWESVEEGFGELSEILNEWTESVLKRRNGRK